jgi:hypothetical protein
MSYGYEIGPGDNQGLSNKQLALIFGVGITGFLVLLFLFPNTKSFRESVSEQVVIVTKSDGDCVVNSQITQKHS